MKKILMILLISVLILCLLPVGVLAQSESDTWSWYRPSSDKLIDQRVQNAKTDEEASIGIGVHILRYFENAPDDPYVDNDGVRLKVVATANTRKGITYQSSWGAGLMHWIEANAPIPGMDPPEDDDVVQIDLPFPVRSTVVQAPKLGAQNTTAFGFPATAFLTLSATLQVLIPRVFRTLQSPTLSLLFIGQILTLPKEQSSIMQM